MVSQFGSQRPDLSGHLPPFAPLRAGSEGRRYFRIGMLPKRHRRFSLAWQRRRHPAARDTGAAQTGALPSVQLFSSGPNRLVRHSNTCLHIGVVDGDVNVKVPRNGERAPSSRPERPSHYDPRRLFNQRGNTLQNL